MSVVHQQKCIKRGRGNVSIEWNRRRSDFQGASATAGSCQFHWKSVGSPSAAGPRFLLNRGVRLGSCNMYVTIGPRAGSRRSGWSNEPWKRDSFLLLPGLVPSSLFTGVTSTAAVACLQIDSVSGSGCRAADRADLSIRLATDSSSRKCCA